ncbi:MAG: hypothetical protein NTV51_04620 [Verrucomicrobia bacterium]|nr:hypothetical protein [Verrucomicrobiota bacterium]
MPRSLLPFLAAVLLSGCIHVTMDVNAKVDVNVKVDKALDDLFGDLDKKDASMKPGSK